MTLPTFAMSRLLAAAACLGVHPASQALAGPAAAANPAPDAPANAPANPPVDESSLVTAKLLATTDLVAPGEEVVLLLELTVAKGWHTYWAGPSETGYPLKPRWNLPAGWKVVKTDWPVPFRYISPGDILDHVYEDTATLVVTLRAPADATPGSSASLGVDVAWLACQEACIPGRAKADLEVRIAPSGVAPSATNIDAQMTARAALPVPLKPGDESIVKHALERTDSGWAFKIQAGRAERIRFFPGPDCAPLPNLLREGDVAGTASVIAVEAKADETPRLQGIIQVVFPALPDSGKPARVSSFSIDTGEPAPKSPPNTP